MNIIVMINKYYDDDIKDYDDKYSIMMMINNNYDNNNLFE